MNLKEAIASGIRLDEEVKASTKFAISFLTAFSMCVAVSGAGFFVIMAYVT